MKLEHLSLIMGLTKAELKRRMELGQIDTQMLNRQVSEYSQELKLDALCDSWTELKNHEQFDRYQRNLDTEK
jgi:PleD family two-component response regulator